MQDVSATQSLSDMVPLGHCPTLQSHSLPAVNAGQNYSSTYDKFSSRWPGVLIPLYYWSWFGMCWATKIWCLKPTIDIDSSCLNHVVNNDEIMDTPFVNPGSALHLMHRYLCVHTDGTDGALMQCILCLHVPLHRYSNSSSMDPWDDVVASGWSLLLWTWIFHHLSGLAWNSAPVTTTIPFHNMMSLRLLCQKLARTLPDNFDPVIIKLGFSITSLYTSRNWDASVSSNTRES